jgi:GMP reductase
MKFKNSKSINFSDVNLLSEKISLVEHRDDVLFENNRLIVAPMSALQNSVFNSAAISIGLSLQIHRFCSIEDQHQALHEAVAIKTLFQSKSLIWLCVGLNDYKKRIDPIYQFLQDNQIGILFDVANGYSTHVGNTLKAFNASYELPNTMTGNVHAWSGFEYLERLESKFIRVGIGNGLACETSNRTGIARGQISAIVDIVDKLHSANLVSDGGIRSPADVAKAFGAGADYVMMGSVFAQASESESQKTGVFYGGASSMQKEKMGTNRNKYVEGKELHIEQSDTSLLEIVTNISDGIKSAISYSGYIDLESFIGNGIFEINQ